MSKAHETCNSLEQFLFADYPSLSHLSPSILSQFTLKVCAAAENC